MKTPLWFYKLLSMAVFLVLVTTACSSGILGSSNLPPIRIFYTSWPGDYPLVLAAALGYYEKYGVNVELKDLTSYEDGLVDFLNHEVDTLNTKLTDAILISQENEVQVVWLQDNSLSTILSVQTIATPEDLRGKRIGVDIGSGLGELVIDGVLLANHLTIQDVILVDISPDAVPTALGKKIDAGYTWSPFTQQAVALGHKTLIQIPGFSPGVMIVRTSLVNERPTDVNALIEAWSEAVDYWESNPIESLNIIASYYNLPPDSLSLGVEEGIDTYSRQQNMEAFTPGWSGSLYEIANLNLNYLVETGGIRRVSDINKLINWEFVGRAIQETD